MAGITEFGDVLLEELTEQGVVIFAPGPGQTLTPGALSDWEFSFGGLVFGADHVFGVNDVEGLDAPEARLDEIERPGDDGSWAFAGFVGARRIVIAGDLVEDPDNIAAQIDAWKYAFRPRQAPEALNYKEPGVAERLLWCLPTRRTSPKSLDANLGRRTWAVELIAQDPRIYTATLKTASSGYAAAIGATFDIVAPLVFGGGGWESAAVINDGNRDTYPKVRIEGPVTNPSYKNLATGEQMAVTGITLGGADYLEFDHFARTVYLNGSTNKYGSTLAGSAWWRIQPGVNTVQVGGTGLTTATKWKFEWRDAWE